MDGGRKKGYFIFMEESANKEADLATYNQLITLLDEQGAHYPLIDRVPEGRTGIVSRLCSNERKQAAKCMVVMVKIGKKVTKYILAVVPGDTRVDLNAVKALFNGTYVSFASGEIAGRLARSVSGTILPFSFSPELELIVDFRLVENSEIYFNAARLDRSLTLQTPD